MPLKPQELGERLHVDLRAGVAGVSRWRGVCREGDPASIADDQLWYGQNVRLTGGKIITRGGQAAVNTAAGDGCIDGFFDAGDMGAQDPETYSTDLFFARETTGNLNKITTAHAVSQVVAEGVNLDRVTRYDGYLYYRAAAAAGTYTFRRVPLGSTTAENTLTVSELDANDVGPTGPVVMDNKLWFLYAYNHLLSPNNGRIYSWNGSSVTTESSFTYANTGSAFAVGSGAVAVEFEGGVLFVESGGGFSANSTVGVYRNAAGTLSYPTLPTALDPCRGRMSVLGSKVYIPFSTTIGTFNGTAMATAHTPTGVVFMGSTCRFGDYVYYVYKITGDSARLGRTDGVTFTDNVATIGTIEGEFSDLISHNGSLYLLTDSDGGSTGSGVWKSNGETVTSWTNVYTADGVSFGAASGLA